MRLYLYPMLLHDVHRDSTLTLSFTDNFVSASTTAVQQIAPCIWVCINIWNLVPFHHKMYFVSKICTYNISILTGPTKLCPETLICDRQVNSCLLFDMRSLRILKYLIIKLTCTCRTGLLSFLCGAGNFGKIWSACGKHEIQYTEWRMNKYKHTRVYNFTCAFLCTFYTLIIRGKVFLKCNLQPALGCRYSSTYLRNKFVI
jgi:hypothetical protein